MDVGDVRWRSGRGQFHGALGQTVAVFFFEFVDPFATFNRSFSFSFFLFFFTGTGERNFFGACVGLELQFFFILMMGFCTFLVGDYKLCIHLKNNIGSLQGSSVGDSSFLPPPKQTITNRLAPTPSYNMNSCEWKSPIPRRVYVSSACPFALAPNNLASQSPGHQQTSRLHACSSAYT